MERKIIGFVGTIGSGKDTAADCLINEYGFVRDSFAKSLKDAVSAVFGWDREMLEGKTADDRMLREQVDLWWAERLNIPHLTPRWVLQYWGTEVCRHGFHDDIWIASLEHRLGNSESNIVISDVRFPNEIKAIRDMGGTIVRVKRGDDPVWYNSALEYNNGTGDDSVLKMFNVHPSEYSWVGQQIDLTILNIGSIEDLYTDVRKLI